MDIYIGLLVQIKSGNKYKKLCFQDELYIPIYWEMLIAAGNLDFENDEYTLSAFTTVKKVDPYVTYYKERNIPNFALMEFKNFLYKIKGHELKIEISELEEIYIEQQDKYDSNDDVDFANISDEELLERIIKTDFEHNFFPTSKAKTFDDLVQRYGFVEENYQTNEYKHYSDFKNPQKLRTQIEQNKIRIWRNILTIIFFIILWCFTFWILGYAHTFNLITLFFLMSLIGGFLSMCNISSRLRKFYKVFCFILVAVLIIFIYCMSDTTSVMYLFNLVISLHLRISLIIAFLSFIYLSTLGLGIGFNTVNWIKSNFKYKNDNVTLKKKLQDLEKELSQD